MEIIRRKLKDLEHYVFHEGTSDPEIIGDEVVKSARVQSQFC